MLQSVYKLLIIEPNPFIRLGVEAILKRNNRFRVQLTNTMDMESLMTSINFFSPDIILANPIAFGFHAEVQWKSAHRSKLIALCVNNMYSGYLTGYDATLNLEEQPEAFVQQILSTIALPEEEDLDDENERLLSPREKDVVAFVAKGLTNKEIASKLSISIHTVITHRRNIAKKLKIHSPSGLTIYAIVNKLVNIDEIQA